MPASDRVAATPPRPTSLPPAARTPSTADAEAAVPAASTTLARPGVALDDALWADAGVASMTGTQALLRVLRMQADGDRAAGRRTQGFLSGYRGSPLGAVDQAVWKAGARWRDAGLRFLPAVNEELAATAVLGTQRVGADPERTVDGVFAMWYGKGPGVDRAGDAIKHGNAYGSSPLGGVLVVAGDDHGCVSSSMPHQSDLAFEGWGMPVVSPACVADLVEFGLYGVALSRFSGQWVGLTAVSEVVEGSATVDLDAIAARRAAWVVDADEIDRRTGHRAPADGLHYRWPDLPSLRLESRLADKMAAARAFAAVNTLDRLLLDPPQAALAIVTAGKAHFDVLEALRRLAITLPELAAHGVRLVKIGLTVPLDTPRLAHALRGVHDVLVVEEKAGVVEAQLKQWLYHAPDGARPRIWGKTTPDGAPWLSALGELRPSRVIEPLAQRLAALTPALDRRAAVPEFTPTPVLANAGDAVRRMPYFCAGCPHNTSTRVPEGSRAAAGIGCHFMANWMERDTAGLIQMGGEGVDWVSHAMFTRVPHIFQNLGDGTYYHSGYLAIRQAVAAGARITYKILYNDAVAMTGGQPVDGTLTVDAIAQQVNSEGVARVVVVSDDIEKYAGHEAKFPSATRFEPRERLDAVQRELREVDGVTVLIYEQTCAAEQRRRRKQGSVAAAAERWFIHEAVCEGCGDCGVQSNCVAVLPKDTPFGRKRTIDQTACNQDASCARGFCPSFVSVRGATLRKRAGALGEGPAAAAFRRAVDALPEPPAWSWTGPYDLLVTGVGGTGVVTVGALVAMAAHLDGHASSVLDFMGFAQKGGAVMSFVRWADTPSRLNQVRIDAQQADAVLACDLVVAASPEALQTLRHARTRVLVNTHLQPVADLVRHPDGSMHEAALLAKVEHAAGAGQVQRFDAQRLARDFLGDTVTANVIALGQAWQRGMVPVSRAALERAIALNGVAVGANLAAWALGRLSAHDPAACDALLGATTTAPDAAPLHGTAVAGDAGLRALVDLHAAHLERYQDARWAQRFRDAVARIEDAERAAAVDADLTLTRAVARSLGKLMAYKDEYEVARLYSDGAFAERLRDTFDGDPQVTLHFAPLLWPARQVDGVRGDARPAKRGFDARRMQPLLRLLARLKGLRGGVFDVFGRHPERRAERARIGAFLQRIDDDLRPALARADAASVHALLVEIASLPQTIRGFGPIQQRAADAAAHREAELLHRLDPQRHPAAPPRTGGDALRAIPVVVSRAA